MKVKGAGSFHDIYRKENSGGDHDSREFGFKYINTKIDISPRISASGLSDSDVYFNLSPNYNKVRYQAQKCVEKVENYILQLSLGQLPSQKVMPFLKALRRNKYDILNYVAVKFDLKAYVHEREGRITFEELLIRSNNFNGGASVPIDGNGDCDFEQAVQNFIDAVQVEAEKSQWTDYSGRGCE